MTYVDKFRAGEIIKLKQSCKTWTRRKFKIEVPALVAKAETITKALSVIKGLNEIKKGENVLIKPNINSDDKYPGTTRPEGLKELIRLIKRKGAHVSVGDMSSAFWSHTKICSEKTGIRKICAEEKVPLIFFEDSKWVKVELPNTSLGHCYITDELCNYKHLVNLCVLKTHRLADFTLSMKNLMGILHMRTRMKMHAYKLKERIGEFNMAVNPVINIVDGTKCFIDGGPDTGELRKSNVVFASKDRIALDVMCIKELQNLGSKSLKGLNPWTHPQISSAVKHKIGVDMDSKIKVIE
ncbi:MAG: DUF362 domain-containing protein [Candidatus Nanoarchaeia archaeon]|nr:DUF362 domain-containing protein [Candidatus Nanoarchaeia archaeon]